MFILSTLHCPSSIIRGENVADLFTAMPDSIFPLLTEKNRHDMVDFFHNHMQAKVRNRLNDYVVLDTLTDDYLHVTLSKSSTAELKCMQASDSTVVIALVQTLAAPVRDSQVEFYDGHWQRLPQLKMPVPATRDFFTEFPDSVARDMDFAQRSIDDLRLLEIKAEPDADIFTLTLSCQELMEDEKKVATRYVRSLRYRWTGREFVRMDL